MAGGFKRSGRFGLIGVFVVMAICVAIALTTGSGEDASPKLTLGLIFGVIAVYVVILFTLQRADLDRASGTDMHFTERAVAEGGGASEVTVRDLWLAERLASC